MKYFFGIILIIYVVLHIPFLQCDPHYSLDIITRGAWTDEGLYTSQLRNFIHHHYFNIKENSTFIRGPLFNIIQLPFFLLFGTKLVVSRLIVLCFTVLALFKISQLKQYRFLAITMIPLVFLEFHVFSFSHYGLSDLLSISLILLGFYYLMKAYESENVLNKKLLFYSALSIACSYFVKIQFAYIIIVFGLTTLAVAMVEGFKTRNYTSKFLSVFYWHTLFNAVLGLLYFTLWYLPNKTFYNYVMNAETIGRFPSGFVNIIKGSYWVFKYLFISKGAELQMLFYILIAVAIVSIIYYKLDKQKKNTYYIIPVIFSICWIIIESHKLSMLYIPYRYMLGLIVAIGLLSSSLLAPMLSTKNTQRYFAYVVIGVVTIYNLNNIRESYVNRTWQIQKMNTYFSKYNFKEQPVIGPWASSCTWESNAITLPTWNNYLNYRNPINTYNPRVVITEKNELDTDFLYASQGINLDSISDSSKIVKIRNYDIVVYWIRQK